MATNGEFSFSSAKGRNGLPKITTNKKKDEICHDDSAPPVKAQTIDELHSLQKKKSAPTTPIKGTTPSAFASIPEEDRQRQQLQSISASLASLTRETGPKVVRGDPARTGDTPRAHVTHHHSYPTLGTSDSALKFTHILYNLSPAELYEQAIQYEKGSFITSSGALATLSGAKTGRSPRDKRVVRDETTEDELWWGKGSPNIEMDEHTFLVNRERAVDYLCSLEKVFVNDQFLNWDPNHRIKVRIVSARAYHSLFMHNMCIRPTPEELEDFGTPDFTIYNAGQFPCNRYTHYMTSSTSIDLNLARREMVILGTQYAGEMKKGLFSVMHYLMPKRQILSLHSGCNMGKDGDVALFFGLSGTGKTTLSTDHNRYLIGDDEHCWSENGVSNIEGGCYAKCIDLSGEKEPDIWNAIKFGTVMENVVFDEHTREVDYSDKSVTVAKLSVLFPEQADTEANVKRIFELDPVTRSFKAFPVLFSPERIEDESPSKPVKMSTATTRSKALVSTADLLAGAKARRSLRKDNKLPPTPLSMASSSVSKNKEESKKRKLVESEDTDASDVLDGEKTREKFVVVMKDFADKLSGIMTPIMDQAAILKIKVARSSVEAEEARKEMKVSAGEISKLKKEVKMQSNEIVKLRKELADACAERLTENEAHVKELEAAREDFKFNATKALLETRIQMMEEMKSGLAVHWDLEEERKTLEDFISEPVDAEEVNSPALEELIEDANKVLSSMVEKQIEGEKKETEVTPTAVGQNVDKV